MSRDSIGIMAFRLGPDYFVFHGGHGLSDSDGYGILATYRARTSKGSSCRFACLPSTYEG